MMKVNRQYPAAPRAITQPFGRGFVLTRTVAIVGRPNVGKSTLFNRLAGKKLAIVHDRPGVTRDRREAQARVGGLALTLVDTAGAEEASPETIPGRMREQTDLALQTADLNLFVIDARAGVTEGDRVFAEALRRANRPVLLVANKCEGFAGDAGLYDSYSLGFGDPVPVSAEHGEGVADLVVALREVLPEAAGQSFEASEQPPLRLAMVGRPNAGKSTLVNALIGEDRMITGPEPGLTRDSVSVRWDFDGREIRLHDTAGLRKKAKVVDSLERLSAADTLRAVRFAEIVFLVMDADHALETQDMRLADLVVREGRGLVFVINKWDQVDNRREVLDDLRHAISRMDAQVAAAPVLTVSGLTGEGVDGIMAAALALHTDWSAKVKTRDLNDWLAEAVSRNPPPAVNGKRIKPRYISQTKSRPPTFVLMASRAEHLPESYKRYLVNGIRKAFGLGGAPIRLVVRSGANPYASSKS